MLAADRMTESGRHLDACKLNNLARFPFPANPAQERAAHRCVAEFDQWRSSRGGIDRLELELSGHRVPVWATGLDPGVPRPLLLLIGGIVSVKEQWAPSLPAARRLGMAAVAAEMPGVGENPLPYGHDSWRMLSGMIDKITEIAPVREVYAVAMSFGGHLALRCAAHDPRLSGLVTVGPPVSAFFRDRIWWTGVPETTKRALAHLLRVPKGEVPERLGAFALRPDELTQVQVPVYSVVSLRDEIIPSADTRVLERHLAKFKAVRFDDVHGSPGHVLQTKLWIVHSLLRLRTAGYTATFLKGFNG
ncbi:alpha/beta fold hydrolase [Amycolatopsis sp. EV170708-02-1]|uniref:alpha/beta fold hydrolase n=1 Tax=Amycolatopsis sp. EV170708-02-1 TaxID=2919322 RepID=UPI001F0CA77E|nr:alpha/beta fold hydrolase [Amycolatopsis sp. EV170708-02-1]UMP06804.1 alpha/beta fold hydrolase [Amycolatopsis sp. EV170708-02-1]